VFIPLPALLLLLVIGTGCERTSLPVISDMHVQEVEPTIVETTATITGDEIGQCGICYSTTNTAPTPEVNDSIVYGTLTGEQLLVRTTLAARTTYYIAVFATNESGRTTTSNALKLTTTYITPDKKDNPLPNL